MNSFSFLSFQDALHYLVKAYGLAGKTILVPAFYCDATLNDMKQHGLEVITCGVDRRAFEVDLSDFEEKLKSNRPDVVIIYNFFGKDSRLYRDRGWTQHIRPDIFLISDFAHSLIPNHEIEFLCERHFYIDSARKTTACMMAHLLAPSSFALQRRHVVRLSLFKLSLRILYFARNLCFRLAMLLPSNALCRAGMQLYGLHDRLIGSPVAAFTGFDFDAVVYSRIDFARIRQHRRLLFAEYTGSFASLVAARHIETFAASVKEQEDLCFFFARIPSPEIVSPLLEFLQGRGFWAERLWNFDKSEDISASEREWGKSIIVFPYTINTSPGHVRAIASLMRSFFETAPQNRISPP